MASYQQHSGYPLQVSVQRDPEPRTRSAHIMPTTLMLHPAALQVTETNVIAPAEVDKRAPVVPRSASPKYPVIPTTVDIDGLGRLTPGALYSIPDAALPTAQAILNQTYTVPAGGGAYAGAGPRWYSFAIVPRRPEYSGGPSLPMLAFSVDGLAGIPLRALRDLTADDIDGAGDKVWDALGWKKTSLSIDWPGVPKTGDQLSCVMSGGKPCTRLDVAHLVGYHLVEFFKGKALKWGPQALTPETAPWALAKTRSRDIRVLGISYYRKAWVPILAIDATGRENVYQ